MALYAEVWARPGHPSFARVIAEPPTNAFGYQDGVNVTGRGSMQVPSSYDRFDDILLIDPDTPANSVSSLVRIYDDATDPPTLVMEWLPRSIMPQTSKRDFDVSVQGNGIKSVLGYARTEAWDWDGSAEWQPTFPDWIYGGPNLLSNPGFEDSAPQPPIYELMIDASAGTFEINDGTNSTGNLAFNISDGALEAALEAMAPTAVIDDALVTPIDGGFQIEIVNPFDVNNLVVDDSGLTGEATLSRTQTGALQPGPWTRSQQISFGTPREFGTYENFRVVGPSTPPSGPVHSGNFSLWINPAPVASPINQFPGAQQVVSVSPGGLYQASIWVYSVNGGEYRFVLRALDEDLIVWHNVTVPAATWTQVTISDVIMETANGFQPSQIIFRFANIEPSGTISDFYLDDAQLTEGNAATTVGAILGDLYDDATSDHVADGRLVWEDEANPGTAYLTLDFTDSVDSNGNAWDRSDISIRLWMRMSYLQVMTMFAETYGYEWRIVPDDPDAGTWLWQVFNPGGMTTDYTADANPAIQGGTADTRRSIERFMPEGTDLMIEGLERMTARASNAGLTTALGRIETARIIKELPLEGSIADAAQNGVNTLLSGGVQYGYVLTDPVSRPGVAYIPGDTINLHDPPVVDAPGRLADLVVSVSPTQTDYEVIFVPPEEPTSP